MIFTQMQFRNIFITICFLIFCNVTYAQADHRLGEWNVLIIKGKIAPRFTMVGESNMRNSARDFNYNYFEIKGGISYAFNKNISGLVGSGFYNTYTSGGLFLAPAVQNEIRTWLELDIKHAYKRLNFEHRLRIEQRFIPENYKNRFRYKLGLNLPVNNSLFTKGTLYFALYNEFFISQQEPFLSKNRFFAGGGYKITGNTTFQVGCINDTDYLPNTYSVKNYLQLILIYDFTKLINKHA